MMRVSVIILNWNGKHYLEECLSSVFNQTFKDFEVLFVDNGSSDRSVEFIRQSFPDVRLIELKENVGFAKGNNVAIERAAGDYIVLLNNDTRVFKDWLKTLVEVADSNPEAGVVGSLNLEYGTDVCQAWGNSINLVNNFVFFDKYLGRGKNSFDNMFNENKEVDYVQGSAFLVKREVFERVGLIDEIYFAYNEEIDWQYRIRQVGYKVLTSDAKLWHHGGASNISDWYKEYLIQRNRMIFFRLNTTGALKYWNLFITQPVHYLFVLGNSVFKGTFKSCFKGIKEAVRWNIANDGLKSQVPTLSRR